MSRRAAAGLLLGALLLSACGLPVEEGVRSPGQVTGDAQAPGRTQVVPKGPQPDAGPRAIVQGFLTAQVSADDDHALAREFLAPQLRDTWSDEEVLVREAALELTVADDDETEVVVRADVLASIAEDGAYRLEQRPFTQTYTLSRGVDGQLRLVDVPAGLLLSPRDAAQSFEPRDVYFLRGRSGDDTPRLVADRVFLPVGEDPADSLVRQLLAGPSTALTNAVTTAFPAGTQLRRPVRTADGVVTVDLTGEVLEAAPQARRDLSAQLVWTLRGAGSVFTSLRLLVDGRPLPVDGVGQIQQRDDWPAYDPVQAAEGGPALLVRDRRLAVLQGAAPPSDATNGTLAVDAAVASPGGDEVALLTRTDAGDVVRVGPVRGPFEVVLSRPSIASLSWGSGDEGLWVVEGGAQPQVLLVLDGGDGVITVPHSSPPGAGPLAELRTSRDGARAAAVFGEGASRQVHVGRVERPADGSIRLTGFSAVAPALTDVVDVAWESGTSLIVLGSLGTATRLPVRVAVDGSELDPVRLLGLDGDPQSVTVTPGQPLVVGTLVADAPVVFVEEGGLFREPVPGVAPRYPG